MFFKYLIFVTLVSTAMVNGQTWDQEIPQYQCQNELGEGFKLVQSYNPRNKSEAKLENIEGANYFGGVWLQLDTLEDGSLISKYTYSTMNGAKLILVIKTSFDRGGCGRGSCTIDGSNVSKYISVKLVVNEQEINYDCI